MSLQRLFAFLVIPVVLSACAPASSPPDSAASEAGRVAEPAAAASPGRSSDEGIIQSAMSAAPMDLASNATIEHPDESGNMRVLRQGTNGWVCRVQPFAMCLDGPWQAFMAARAKKASPTVTALGISYMLQGDGGASNVDPFATGPAPDNDWVVTGPHLMIITPDAAHLEALPDNHRQGGPWVMWKGTPYAHVMLPIDSMQ